MLTLHDTSGSELKLAVTRYQFPLTRTDDWLMVRGHATFAGRSWSFEDPALDARELLQLAEWFDGLADDSPGAKPSLYFTEPNLSFEFLAADAMLHVRLAYEASPPWLPQETKLDGVILSFRRETLLPFAIATSIRAAAEAFPPRSRNDR